MLISYSMIDNVNERKKFVEISKIKNLNEAIIEYAVFNKEEKLLNCSKEIREFLKNSYGLKPSYNTKIRIVSTIKRNKELIKSLR